MCNFHVYWIISNYCSRFKSVAVQKFKVHGDGCQFFVHGDLVHKHGFLEIFKCFWHSCYQKHGEDEAL